MRRISLCFSFVAIITLTGCAAGGSSSSASSEASSSSSSANPDISVSQPQPYATVTSPLVVKGQARGTWYFEASFPVHLLDSHGTVITSIPAQAQGDWMTTNFVPFVATLSFTTTSQTGSLVLENDNPSGDPLKAKSINIPVHF